MRGILYLAAVLLLSAQQDLNSGRLAALAAAHRGDWRSAEQLQRRVVEACRACSPEDRAIVRAELAGYLTLGNFPEAAIPLWKQTIAELPAASPLYAGAYLGLGVALFAAGQPRQAHQAWDSACSHPSASTLESAACRFNVAVARPESAASWSEMEHLLPVLLPSIGPLGRATVLLQTAHAAQSAGQPARALALLNQAESVVTGELNPNHPFRGAVFQTRATIAAAAGDKKQARLWRKKAEKLPMEKQWDRGTVSIEELRGKHE
jgi:tetratricopeptide (TPR) repeat protein